MGMTGMFGMSVSLSAAFLRPGLLDGVVLLARELLLVPAGPET